MRYAIMMVTALASMALLPTLAWAQACEWDERVCTEFDYDPTRFYDPCNCTSEDNRHHKIVPSEQSMMIGQWMAACGKDKDTRKHEFTPRSLDQIMTLRATLAADLRGNLLSGPPVTLTGIIQRGAKVNGSPLATQFRTYMNNHFIWGCETPPAFVGALGGNTGELGNRYCPPACTGDDVNPDVYNYSVEFVRSDCVGMPASQRRTDCDIPEGQYKVSMVINGMSERVAPDHSPCVERQNGECSGAAPIGYGIGKVGSPPPQTLSGGVAAGSEPWALADPGPRGSENPYNHCISNACPAPYSSPYVFPYIAEPGEQIVLDSVQPEMFMMGNIQMEFSRRGEGDANITFNDFDSSINGRIFAGYDYLNSLTGNVVYTNANGWWTPAEQTAFMGPARPPKRPTPATPPHRWNTEPYPVGGSPASAPWTTYNPPAVAPDTTPRNLIPVRALEIVRDTSGNVPQNIVTALGTFDTIVNRLTQGYAPYNIHNGMAVSQCALLKGGAKMLQDATSGMSMRRNLVYVGGCPTNNTATTTALFEGNTVRWFASSNVGPGGKPGEINPANLRLQTLNNPNMAGLPGATEQCFKDVKGTVDNLFMMTSTQCGTMADNVAELNMVGSGCERACKLGAGGDTVSDCAARFLYCLTGATREIRKR